MNSLTLALFLAMIPATPHAMHTPHIPPGAVADVPVSLMVAPTGCEKFTAVKPGYYYRDMKMSINGVTLPKCR